MTKRTSGLAAVQDLYLIQCDLYKAMSSDLTEKQELKEAKDQLKNFSSLLKSADPRYMGGEDVYNSLKEFEQDVKAKIK